MVADEGQRRAQAEGGVAIVGLGGVGVAEVPHGGRAVAVRQGEPAAEPGQLRVIGRPPVQDRRDRAVVAPIQGDPARACAGVGVRLGEDGEHPRRLLPTAELAQGLGQRHPRPAVRRVGRDEPPEVLEALVRLPDDIAR